MTDPKREVSVIIRAKDATQAAFATALGRVQSFASRAASALTSFGALVGGAALGGLFKKAVEESIGAQKAFDQLGLVLANIGVDFARVRPEVDAVFDSLRKVAGIDDDEAAGALATLVRITGDYTGSLKQMRLVADLSAGANLSLDEAAEKVGRAMLGNTKSLREYGVTAKDAAGALAELSGKFAGEAERMGQSFEGVLKRTQEGFNNFLQSIGDLITGNQTVRVEVSKVAVAFERLATWIATHAEEAAHYLTTTIRFVQAIGTTLWGVARIAFNVGEVIGRVLVDTFLEVRIGFTKILDSIAATLNGFIQAANLLPGVEIEFRLPRFQEDLADLRRAERANWQALKGDLGDMGDAVVDVAKAWVAVGEAAETAGQKSRAAAGRTVKDLRGSGGPAAPSGPIASRGILDVGARTNASALTLPPAVVPVYPVVVLDDLAEGMPDVMGEIAEGFAQAAVELEGAVGDIIGAAFTGGLTAAGDELLAAVGGIFSQLGKMLITAGLGLEKLALWLKTAPLFAGPAMVAAGALLAGLGARMSKAAQGNGRGGGGGAVAGGGRAGSAGTTDALSGAAQRTATVVFRGGTYDVNDPRRRREITENLQGVAGQGVNLRVIFEGG